jgi:hypothetical protein
MENCVSMTRFILSRLGILIALAALMGCDVPGPEHAKYPTSEQLVATPQAVGVPYDRFVLIRDGDRSVALRISSQSPWGELIRYEWAIAESVRADVAAEFEQRGMGQSKEDRVTGTIAVPDLHLTWSRGSTDLGWIYWPKDGRDFRVFSRPFAELDKIDTSSKMGKWLVEEQFRK